MTSPFDRPETDLDAWLFRTIASSALAVIVVDLHGVVSRWGAGAEALFGWTAAEATGRKLVDLRLVTDPIRQRRATDLRRRVLNGESWAGEWTARRRDGTPVAVSTVQQPLRDARGKVAGFVSLSVDASARDRFEAALLREAMHDPLTGLPNRTLLLDRLSQLVDAHDHRPGSAAVLFVDLDGFKTVNDVYGHATGDAVLREVARRLLNTVREGDMVGRLGGDEFVVLCRFGANPASVIDIAGRIGQALARPVTVGPSAVEISASVGVALPSIGTDAEALLARADAAMYRAKRTEADDVRGRVVVFAEAVSPLLRGADVQLRDDGSEDAAEHEVGRAVAVDLDQQTP